MHSRHDAWHAPAEVRARTLDARAPAGEQRGID
jgi:hypothetical protein